VTGEELALVRELSAGKDLVRMVALVRDMIDAPEAMARGFEIARRERTAAGQDPEQIAAVSQAIHAYAEAFGHFMRRVGLCTTAESS
jgi:hypothetical protein